MRGRASPPRTGADGRGRAVRGSGGYDGGVKAGVVARKFLRAFAEQSYGIPPEQVIGSRGKTKFELRDGRPVIVKQPGIDFVDDAEGKPVAIQQQIGRRPIAAFGNSDGDLAMLQWTCLAEGPRLCLYVHHTDAAREWAYDRKSSIGRLDRGLAEAAKHGWTVVSIRDDWKRVFAFEAR